MGMDLEQYKMPEKDKDCWDPEARSRTRSRSRSRSRSPASPPGSPSKYRVSAITPNLLIGDIISSASIALLMRHSVTAIVSLTRYRNEEWDRPANRVLIPQALHLHVPILDSPNEDILSHLPTICDFIDLHLSKPITTTTTVTTSTSPDHGPSKPGLVPAKYGGADFGPVPTTTTTIKAFSSSSTTTQHHPSDSRVLVHCHIGKSRSPTAVAAYLMRSQGLSVEEALRVIKAGREIAEPNAGFLKQLHLWEELKYELYEDPAKGALPKEAYEKHLKEIAKEKNAMYDALIKSDMDRMLDLRSRSSQTSSSVGRSLSSSFQALARPSRAPSSEVGTTEWERRRKRRSAGDRSTASSLPSGGSRMNWVDTTRASECHDLPPHRYSRHPRESLLEEADDGTRP